MTESVRLIVEQTDEYQNNMFCFGLYLYFVLPNENKLHLMSFKH
jgi:hypothetical protein